MLKFLRRRSGVGESKRRVKPDAQQCSNSTDCIDDEHGQYEFADPEVTAVKLIPLGTPSSRSFSCPHIFKPPGAHAGGAYAQAVDIDITNDENAIARLASESDFTTSMEADSEPQLADELAQSDASGRLPKRRVVSPTPDPNKRRTASEGDVIDSAERDGLEMSNDELDAVEADAYDAPLDDALAALLNEPCIPPNLPTPGEFSEHVARVDPSTEVRLPSIELCLQSALYDCLEKHITYAYLIRMTRTYLIKRLREDLGLSSKQINRVFPRHCIDSLVRLHCPLAHALKNQYDASAAKPLMRIADYSALLLEHYRSNENAIVDAYAKLQANQAIALAEYRAWRNDKQNNLAASLDALRQEENCKQHGVDDLLQLFSSRLAYWPSIFEAIATYIVSVAARNTTAGEKKLLETHENTWKQLIALSKSVVEQVESRTVVYENEKKLADLRERFDPRVVALFYKPDSPPAEKAIAQQLQNVPSVVTRRAICDTNLVLPALSSVPPRLLRYHGLFGKEQLNNSLRTLLHMDTVHWRNESNKLVQVNFVILSDFILFLRDNRTTSLTGFALDNKLSCAPINYIVMLQNTSNRELNELLVTTRFPHRNEETYQLQCSSALACTQLLDAYKNAMNTCVKSVCIDQSDKTNESRNKLFGLVDQLDEQDSLIQKSISDKMALFCKICDLVHSQFGPRVTSDLRLSKLEPTVEATQLGACLDASNKLYGLLRNPYLLIALDPSKSNASLSEMRLPVVTPRPPNVCDRAICSQDMQLAINATRVLCQSLSKVNVAATQRRQELEAANLKYLNATAYSTTGDNTRPAGATYGDDDGLSLLPSDVSTMHRHGTFVPAKQFAELRTIEEKLQADKLAWEQHLASENARFSALDKALKNEREEVERTRAEVARQFEELKNRRVSFQRLVDQVNEASPTSPPYYDGSLTSPTFSGNFFLEPVHSKLDVQTHEAMHHRPSVSSQTRLEYPSTPQIQTGPPPVPPRPNPMPTGTLPRTHKQSNVLTPSLLALSGTLSSKKETKQASASKQQSDTPTRDRSMSLTTAMPKPKPSLFIHTAESTHKFNRHHDDEQIHKLAL